MKEARAVNMFEANLPQENIDFVNDVHAKEVDYWKRIALGGRKVDEKKKQLRNLAPLRAFLARKNARKSRVENIYEILFYLRKDYSPCTEERARIYKIPQDDRFSSEEMSDQLKTFSKSVIEVENITLKDKVLLGFWASTAAKVFRRDKIRGKNSPNRFEVDGMQNEKTSNL